jgi:uncharacterized protein YjdB
LEILMRDSWRGTSLVPAMLWVLSSSACGVTEADRAPVEAVVVRPEALEVAAGAAGALDAEVTDLDGNVLRDRRVVWATADPAIAVVSDRGVVTGVSAGRVEIAATVEGKSGIAAVTVRALPAQVASVQIIPSDLDLFVAASVDLIAAAYDNRGASISGRNVVWTTNNAAVAAVSQTGRVTGLLPGDAVITAVIDGLAGNARVTVRLVPVAMVTVVPSSVSLDAGKTATLTARASDAVGNVLAGRSVAWSSSDTRIVTVDQGGVIRAVRRGSAVVTALVEGKFGTASVRVE